MSRPPKPVRYVKKPKCCGGRGERRAKRGVCRRTPTNQPASSEAECIEDASIDASGQVPSSKQNPWKRSRGKFVEDLTGKLLRSACAGRRRRPSMVGGLLRELVPAFALADAVAQLPPPAFGRVLEDVRERLNRRPRVETAPGHRGRHTAGERGFDPLQVEADRLPPPPVVPDQIGDHAAVDDIAPSVAGL